jgi:tungstate transport system substrate-binding protein
MSHLLYGNDINDVIKYYLVLNFEEGRLMKTKRSKIFGLLLAVILLASLVPLMAGCTTATTTVTATQTITPTATPTTTTADDSLPLAKPKTRFKIATTTSLYDTGLWYYLEPKFEAKENVELDIVYAGTGAALNQGRNGNVDAVIVHDPDQEKTFIEEGYGINKRAFAYNFFMIAGPASDPAGVKGMDPADALKKIAEAGMGGASDVKFVSRGDGSGTHGAEKRLWAAAGYNYENDIQKSGAWYVEAGQGMGPTLTMADQMNAYVLCDGSTFTSYKGKLALVSLINKPAEQTLNIYDAYAINPDKIKSAKVQIANDFINWLISPEVQKLIGEYGVKEFGGSLFNPISDGGCTYSACPDPAENLKPIEQN